jgi:hypothetical protein
MWIELDSVIFEVVGDLEAEVESEGCAVLESARCLVGLDRVIHRHF